MADSLTPSSVVNRLVAQPGRMLTGVPPFVFVMPEGWILDEAPGALAAIRLPEQVDGFWINALLSHDKVARSIDFESAAKVTWAKLQRSATNLVERGERLIRFGNLVVYVRGCEFASPDGSRTLAQMQALWFTPVTEGGKVVDLFQLVLTAPATAMPKFSGPILEMISTFRFV